jgi:hypothetical protein
MAPKPNIPEEMRKDKSLKCSEVPVQVVPDDTDESDGSGDEAQGNGYGYYLVGQEGTVRPQSDEEDDQEDDMSGLSIQEQVQALVAQAQSVQENLTPQTQTLISESMARQRVEESMERIQIWTDTQTDAQTDKQTARKIEMDGQKVDTIKNIMSNFSLPSTSVPNWVSQELRAEDLIKKVESLKK